MDRITAIEQAIERLEEGKFQRLCNEFLSWEGYHGIVALGSKSGSNKTTLGTPDTYFCEIGGKYVFVEYTTQQSDLKNKIKGDIEKCFDETKTGVLTSQISKIIYCHTSSNLSAGADSELKKYCAERGVELEIIGIDSLADKLCHEYPTLTKDHLGIAIDTQQIQSIEDYIKQYNSNDLSASLSTKFQFRQNDIESIDAAFEKNKVVVLTGNAGVGKTRLAIEYANRRKNQKHEKVFCIHNRALGIYDDLQQYFCSADKFFIIIDDANQLSQLGLVMELANRKDEGYDIHVLITVRQYALEKVKEVLSNIVNYEEVCIGTLSDDEIKKLVKDEFGIVNPYYLDRIADIAKGNARIAMLAGKTASDTNKLESIKDVSQLYDAYYGKAFREAHLDADIQLQTVAGVIAFLNSARMDALDPVLPVLQEQGIDADTFKKLAYELHDLELVDICRDTAVIISDQCFGDFILKYVFYDKKSVSLSAMIEVCFLPFHQRTMQALYNLRNNFNNKELFEFTDREIVSVWDRAEKERPNEFWKYVKAFYPIKQEETLLFIKNYIENVESVELSADQMDFEAGKNNQSINDEILSVLGGFAGLTNYESALDLYFMYFAKRRDLYMQFYHTANHFWGVHPNNTFAVTAYLKKIIACSNDWSDEYISKLFIAFAKEQLRFDFSIVEPGRRNSFNMIHFSLPASEDTFLYRKTIWEQLIKISGRSQFTEDLRKLLKEYADHRGYNSDSIIKAESENVCDLLKCTLSPYELEDCIIAENVISVLHDAGAITDSCSAFLENNELKLYHILIGPERKTEMSFEEREAKKTQDIIQTINNCDNIDQLLTRILAIHAHIGDNGSEGYDLVMGINIAVKQMLENKNQRGIIACTVLRNERIIPPALTAVIENLFTWQSNGEVLSMISNAPNSTKEYCQYLYYMLIPNERITEDDLTGIYAYFRNINKGSPVYLSNRTLHYLLKYEQFDQEIVCNVLRIIYQKKEEVPLLAKCYLPFLLNSHEKHCDTIYERIKDSDMQLLREIYLYGDSIDAMFDCDGRYFKQIAEIDDEFLPLYTLQYLRQDYGFYSSDKETKYRTIFTCKSFMSKIDSIVDTSTENDDTYYFAENKFIRMFIFVEKAQTDKSNKWIEHYIVRYKDNENKERLIFETIAHLPKERKLPFYKLLLDVNDSYEFFTHIPLTPSSYDWIGSAVPLYKGWIDFLKDLNVQISGIKYLEHRNLIKTEIESVEKRIEYEEISNIIEG